MLLRCLWGTEHGLHGCRNGARVEARASRGWRGASEPRRDVLAANTCPCTCELWRVRARARLLVVLRVRPSDLRQCVGPCAYAGRRVFRNMVSGEPAFIPILQAPMPPATIWRLGHVQCLARLKAELVLVSCLKRRDRKVNRVEHTSCNEM